MRFTVGQEQKTGLDREDYTDGDRLEISRHFGSLNSASFEPECDGFSHSRREMDLPVPYIVL